LKRAVAEAYHRTLLARHLAEAIRVSLGESESFERRTRLLLEGGEAARADVVKASSQVAFLRQSATAAELAAALANQDLASFWTREVAEPLRLVDVFDQPLPAPEPAAATGAPFLGRIEFRLLDAQFRGFRAEARREKAALYPQLSLNYQYGLDATTLTWKDRGYAAFVNLHVPVFDWFRATSLSRQFKERAAQVTESRSIAERRFSQEYQSALARVKLFYEQIGQCRAQVSLAEEDVKLSRVRYEGGEGAALDVVVAQNQLAQARSNYYASIASYLNARLDLEVASGR
jgi:outer membrane protein TolC